MFFFSAYNLGKNGKKKVAISGAKLETIWDDAGGGYEWYRCHEWKVVSHKGNILIHGKQEISGKNGCILFCFLM